MRPPEYKAMASKTVKFFSEQSANNFKSEKTRLKFKNIHHYILYLYPTFSKEINTCPFATAACKKACLVNCGKGAFRNVIEARKNRVKRIVSDFESSCKQIIAEIASMTVYNKMLGGGQSVFRINGTSDLDFSDIWNNPELEKLGVIFCEYTKNPLRMNDFLNGKFLPNVHFTFSYSGKNWKFCNEILKKGGNVAIPFACEKLPETYKGYKVIDGDEHDLRYMDEGKGVIVGLKAKGGKVKVQEGVKQGFFVAC